MTQNIPTSINPEELEKFSRIAEEWWDANGKFKPLHKFNPVRIKYIRDKVTEHLPVSSTDKYKPLKGLKILDVGCGGGLLSVPMCRLGGEVTGIDAAEKNIMVAKTHAENEELNIEYIATAVEDLAKTGRKFDVVLNMEVIEHVENVDLFMQKSAEVLKDDGLIFVATLNRNVKSFLNAIVGAEYVLRWLPKGTHDWKKFFKPSEINELFEKNNIKLLEAAGVKYNLFRDEFYLDNSLDVNFMMIGRKV